jgi:hypothetical protein
LVDLLRSKARLTAQAVPNSALVAVAFVGSLGLLAPAARAISQQGKQRTALLGEWYAVGTVLEEHDSAIQVVGETIPRIWLIRSSCSSTKCPLEFVRQVAGPTAGTLGTPIAARLAPAGAIWRANFVEPRVYCEGLAKRRRPGKQ